ncbi:MAG: hypothetical protein AB1894_07440 [Chloroflexota bacterium]
MITDRPPTICAWCGRLAAPEASSETLCGLTCHDQACPESNRENCLCEHARECEICLSTSSYQSDVGMVTHLFWECRCEEAYIQPYHIPDCPACETNRDEGSPARVRDVMLFAHEWRLEPDLVARLQEEFPDVWELDLFPTEHHIN